MKQPTIRRMNPADREAVIQILVDSDPWKRLGYSRTDWDQMLTPLPAGRDSYVLETDGTVAGVAILRPQFLMGDYLELFGVADRARERGLGSRLLAHVESIVFGRTKNLFVCVSDFNQTARAFYRKHSYQEIGSIPNFLIQGSAEILLRKTSGPARKAHG